MVKACLLIKTVPPKCDNLIGEISQVRGVKKVLPVYGRADLVVFMEAIDFDDVLDIIARIHLMDGVRSTETLIEAW
ncbi:MAG: Lrp/AsnC ligand binding domain-containing protein [Nitrososphaeria archaeon]